MSELSGPLAEFCAEAIPQEARFVHKTYPLLPAEDIEQDMWAGVYARRDAFEQLVAGRHIGAARHRLKEAAWKSVREDSRYRRAVKAMSAGYSPSDEQFYRIGLLKTLIPVYLDNGVTERPPKGRELNIIVSGGGGGSDYMAMMLDIAYAMDAVKGYHRRILARYFEYPQGSSGWKHHEIASALGIPPEALRLRVYRALRAMQRVLGGRNPYDRAGLEYSDAPAVQGQRSA